MRPLCTTPIPIVVLTKLKESGYYFVEDILTENKEVRTEVIELIKPYQGSCPDILNLIAVPEMQPSHYYLKVEHDHPQIVTFSQTLDALFGGGIPVSSVIEVCGAPGSGKTQICLQLCVSVQVHSYLGGLQGEAVFIDTDSGFSINRLTEIARGCQDHCLKVAQDHNQNVQTIASHSLDKINYLFAQDYIQLLAAVHSLQKLVGANNKVKLVVVDSLTFPFLELSDTLLRTKLLCRILRHLQALALKYELAVVITNQLTTRITNGESYLLPALGDSVGHLITHRLMVGRLMHEHAFSAILTKNSSLPSSSSYFQVLGIGIRDLQ